MIYTLLERSSDIVGIVGVSLLLMAYYLLSINKITSQHKKYQLLNLCGAIFQFPA